ncbi:hypothetical protein predicted by Glimmer/Critica [Sorangium cellulosum So ce56]|uniref:Uncharacterized protein n=1 Tax=Sorangium cellulosum (strain So ce56) TaxID=448385 RepID=A9G3S0_SORC5|nr:hypothetical protein predicted by Glimmer/Critica [Sorangium cellulosum So ce56]
MLENPLGCYELSRYDGDHIRMMEEVMSVFYPSPYVSGPPPFAGLVASEPPGRGLFRSGCRGACTWTAGASANLWWPRACTPFHGCWSSLAW